MGEKEHPPGCHRGQRLATAMRRLKKTVHNSNPNNTEGSQPQIVQNFNTICNIYIFNNG
jgi:hypothetical protein